MIRILSKGYLPISLIPPSKLEAIIEQVKLALTKTNKDYDLVLSRLYLYYDMKLVTFGIDSQKNLIIQYPVFVQPYTQTRLTLYQIETVPVPILDANNKAQSYAQLKLEKPYIALNKETYISLHPQELNTCRRIGYEYFCEELFVVKSKHKYSCTSTVYFNVNHEIKENCEFDFYFNKTDVTPSVFDGGQQIILMNWSSYKRIICTHNNNIPVNIPSHPYVLLDRNILCNCDIEAESNFLLESVVACKKLEKPDLEIHFTVNLALVDYLDQLNETIDTPIIRNWTNHKQILPISLESFEMNSSLLQAPKTLREFVSQYKNKRKLMDIQEKQIKNSNLKTFISSFITDALLFVAALLTVIITFITIYILSGQPKLKTLVANIALQCVKAIEAAADPKSQENCEFGIVEFLMILNLILVTLMALAKFKKSKVFQGHLFCNMVKIKLFIADAQSCVPLDLNKVAGNVNLFKLTGTLLLDNVTLKKNWIWDILEVNWNDV